jgi:hypothetical protein
LRLRRIAAAVAIATAVLVPVTSTAALAAVKLPVVSVVTGPAAKPPTVTTSGAKIPRAAKIPKASTDTFAVTGTVAAVSAGGGTVTLKVKGGSGSMLGRTVTVKVPTGVKPVVNGKTTTLAKISGGYSITVNGTAAGMTYTATKVVATG